MLKSVQPFHSCGLVCFTATHPSSCPRALLYTPHHFHESLSRVQLRSSKHSAPDSGCCCVILFRLHARGAEPGPRLLSGIPGKVSPQWSCTWPSLCVLCPFSSVYPKYNLILRRFLVGCFHTVGGRESTPDWGAS